MAALTTPQATFFRMNSAGLVEVIDIATGLVIALQKDPTSPPTATLVTTTLEDGREIMVQSGIAQDAIDLTSQAFTYSPALADIIVQKMLEGKTLKEIATLPNFPDAYTLAMWRRHHFEFDEKIRFAKKYRAESLRDEAVTFAEKASTWHKDSVPGAKLKIETLKWAAEKDDPEHFGNKMKVEGQVGLVQMIVETGIRRASDMKEVNPAHPDGHTPTTDPTLPPDPNPHKEEKPLSPDVEIAPPQVRPQDMPENTPAKKYEMPQPPGSKVRVMVEEFDV